MHHNDKEWEDTDSAEYVIYDNGSNQPIGAGNITVYARSACSSVPIAAKEGEMAEIADIISTISCGLRGSWAV